MATRLIIMIITLGLLESEAARRLFPMRSPDTIRRLLRRWDCPEAIPMYVGHPNHHIVISCLAADLLVKETAKSTKYPFTAMCLLEVKDFRSVEDDGLNAVDLVVRDVSYHPQHADSAAYLVRSLLKTNVRSVVFHQDRWRLYAQFIRNDGPL